MSAFPLYKHRFQLLVFCCFLAVLILSLPANAQWTSILFEDFENFQTGELDEWFIYPDPDLTGPITESDHCWGVEDSAIFHPDNYRSLWCYGYPNDAVLGYDDYGREVLTWAKWGPFDLSDFDNVYGNLWLFCDSEANPDGDNFFVVVTNSQDDNWHTLDDLQQWCRVRQFDGSTSGEWLNLSFDLAEVDTNWTFPAGDGETVSYVGRDDCYLALVFQSDNDNNTGLGVVIDDISLTGYTEFIDLEMGSVEIWDLEDPPNRIWDIQAGLDYRIKFDFRAFGPDNSTLTATHALFINDTNVDEVRENWACERSGVFHEHTFNYIWTPSDTGQTDITVHLDILDEVTELYEDNNDSTNLSIVTEPLTPPEIEWIAPGYEPDYFFDEDGNFEIVIHPTNSPSSEMAYLSLFFDLDNQGIDGYGIDGMSLVPIENEIISFNWSIVEENEISEGIVQLEVHNTFWVYARLEDNGNAIYEYAPFPIIYPDAVSNNPASLPDHFSIEQAYPNPFNPTVNIKINLPRAGNVLAQFYAITGQLVDKRDYYAATAGENFLEWTPENLTSGIYYVRLESEFGSASAKIIYLK